jgi:molybdenum cofactor cytidylyltransferase
MIAGIVLAAGLSRRMGRPKVLLPLDGQPVVRHVVHTLITACLDPIIVVAGTEHLAIGAALSGLATTLALNPHPESGQASSIRVGIAALPRTTTAAVVALGDQPLVPSEVIKGLLAARERTGKAIVAPRYRDGRGNPVLFARETFAEIEQLSGDRGARSVIERDPSRVAIVDFDLAMPQDVDTPEDYARLRTPENPVL